jgi:hypothetical protein
MLIYTLPVNLNTLNDSLNPASLPSFFYPYSKITNNAESDFIKEISLSISHLVISHFYFNILFILSSQKSWFRQKVIE